MAKLSFLFQSHWTWKNSSLGLCYSFILYFLCHTDCSFFILFFLHCIKSQMKPLPYHTYSLFSRFLLLSLNHLFLFLFSLFIYKSFLNIPYSGWFKKVNSNLWIYKNERILYSYCVRWFSYNLIMVNKKGQAK